LPPNNYIPLELVNKLFTYRMTAHDID